jgi:hypothetical protein
MPAREREGASDAGGVPPSRILLLSRRLCGPASGQARNERLVVSVLDTILTTFATKWTLLARRPLFGNRRTARRGHHLQNRQVQDKPP